MEIINSIDQSFIAVIFTVVAAIGTFYLEKRKDRISPPKESKHSIELVETVFKEMQRLINQGDDEKRYLQTLNEELRKEVEIYRKKYYEQVEINTVQSAKLTKINLELMELIKEREDNIDKLS